MFGILYFFLYPPRIYDGFRSVSLLIFVIYLFLSRILDISLENVKNIRIGVVWCLSFSFCVVWCRLLKPHDQTRILWQSEFSSHNNKTFKNNSMDFFMFSSISHYACFSYSTKDDTIQVLKTRQILYLW